MDSMDMMSKSSILNKEKEKAQKVIKFIQNREISISEYNKDTK